MRLLLFILFLAVFFSFEATAFGGPVEISNFNSTTGWQIKAISGDTSGSEISLLEDRIEGEKSLLLDFKANSSDADSLRLAKNGQWDLTKFDSIEFWVKGIAPREKLFFFLKDSSGSEERYSFLSTHAIDDITKPAWRRITIKHDTQEPNIKWGEIVEAGFVISDTAGAKSHSAMLLFDYLILTSGPPAWPKTFFYPEEFGPKETAQGIFHLTGFYLHWPISEILKEANMPLKKLAYEYSRWEDNHKGKGYVIGFPTFYKELNNYRILIMEIGTGELNSISQQMLKDWVEGGGRIVYLSGPCSFGKGRIKGKILEDVLPCWVGSPWDLERIQGKVEVMDSQLKRNFSWEQDPRFFWYHKVKPKPQADILLRQDGKPILLSWNYGKGKVIALAGTLFGGDEEHLSFEKWSDFKRFLAFLCDIGGPSDEKD